MANSSQFSNAELFNCDSPVRPDLRNFASRFETFNIWPHESPSPWETRQSWIVLLWWKGQNQMFLLRWGSS